MKSWIISCVTVCAVLFAGAMAQATYVDAMSVNIYVDANGTVSGSQSTPQGGSLGNWGNMLATTTGNNDIGANSDGTYYNGRKFTTSGNLLTATGAATGNFGLRLYSGGWPESNFNNGTEAVNTLGRQGATNGDMPNNWGPATMSLYVSSVPASFQADTYDIYAKVAPNRSGASTAWVKLNSSPLSVASSSYNLTSIVGPQNSIAAVQVMAIGVPEPGTIVLLGTGAVGLLAYAWRRRRA